MKKFLAVVVAALLPAAVWAQAVSPSAAISPTRPQALFVLHPQTGTVVENVNGDARMGPASLTKMMTLYLLFDALKSGQLTLSSTIPVSEKAWRAEGSKMFIEVGKQIPVEDLIRGIAIVSGNDACIAVAEHLGGTEEGFAQLMNKKATELGMTGSHFVNASGLPDPNQYTTAHDMARLLTAIFRDFPEYRHFMAEQEFTFNNIRQQNRNRLLSMNVGIDASKTGHTEESGYHLASTAVQNGQRLVVVVMGTASFGEREGRTLQAFRNTFALYTPKLIAKAGEPVVRDVPVWHGVANRMNLTVAHDVVAYVSKANADQVKVTVTSNSPLLAPLAADAPSGELVVTLPNGETQTYGLVPAQPVEQAGFLKRWWQSLLRLVGLW
ncbi:MAG: D-alanyl-D-alanine carboxypeptidase [Alphaproteobacteria bacterium]|nr:D-alanyl-D-alanine carboxypeptidase [Alphaproteobacteria bacterium]